MSEQTELKPLVIANVGFDVTEYFFPKTWDFEEIISWLNRRHFYYAIFGCPSDKENPFIYVGYY